MLNLRFFRSRRLTTYLSNQFLTRKQDYSFQDEIKLKMKQHSNYDQNLNACIDYGFSTKAILTNDWVMNMDLDHLYCGLKLLKQWNPKQMDDLLILLRMPMKKLTYLTKKTVWESKMVPHGNRIYYFATQFEKKPEEVCYYIMKYKFLYTRNFINIHKIYEILTVNNVPKNDIWKDIWVFMYGLNQIHTRIIRLNNANIAVRPWMLRCKINVFERTLELKQERRFVLNNDSTAQYLAKRLNVPIEVIKVISLKYPTMLRVSPIKLKEVLDFLLIEGYRSSHILRIPRVFTHSIFTLQERLTELRDLGIEPTLTALCKNKISYQELVDNLILKNSKELKKS